MSCIVKEQYKLLDIDSVQSTILRLTVWQCVDYPKGNEVSQFVPYPMPWVNELLDQLGTA